MRSNTRLVALYVLGMMLVNFYGNLGIHTSLLTRKRPDRRLFLSWIAIAIRNLWYAFWKLIEAMLDLFLGLIMTVIGGILVLLFCYEAYKNSCDSYKLFKAGLESIGDAGTNVVDAGYALTSTADYDQLNYNNVRAGRYKALRTLTQDDTMPKDGPVNCDDYPERAPYEVLASVLKESFVNNRRLVTLQIEINKIDLYLRQGFREKPSDIVEIKDRKAMDEESAKKELEILKNKVVLFRSRLKRSVCTAVRSFNEKIDKMINPDKWEGDQKKKYDKLKVDSKSADNNTKQKADKDLAELMKKFDPKNADFKKKMSEMLMAEFKEYNISKEDLSSQFTSNLIRTAMMQVNKDRMVEVQKTAVEMAPGDPTATGLQDKFSRVNNIPLKDDSMMTVIAETGSTGDEEEEKAKDQL